MNAPSLENPGKNSDNRVRLLLCIPMLTFGGAEHVVTNIALHVDRSKFDVCVCCISDAGTDASILKEANIPVKVLGKRSQWDIKTWLKFYQLLRQFCPDIIHSFLFTAGLWTALPAYLSGAPKYIYAVRNATTCHDPQWISLIEKILILPFSHFITFVGNDARETFLERHNYRLEKTFIIKNGVDLKQFSPIQIGPSSLHMIGAIGRLQEQKGYPILLQAFSIVLDEFPNVHLRIVGKGPLREELQELSISLGIEKQVSFAGFIDNVADVFRQIDIYVSASLWEGIPNAHLEAMASGKPIVATAVGGVPEILDKNTAILVPPNDINALADGLVTLLRNPNQAARLAKNARTKVESEFSIQKMAQEYEAIYLPRH